MRVQELRAPVSTGLWGSGAPGFASRNVAFCNIGGGGGGYPSLPPKYNTSSFVLGSLILETISEFRVSSVWGSALQLSPRRTLLEVSKYRPATV